MKRLFLLFLSALLLLSSGVRAAAEGSEKMSWALLSAVETETVGGKKCAAMEGMCCDEKYAYTVKIAGDNSVCSISMIDLDTGIRRSVPYHPSLDPEARPCDVLFHANDLTAVKIDGETHLFVATMNVELPLVRLIIRGGEAYFAEGYRLSTTKNSALSCGALDYISTIDGKIYLLIKKGFKFYCTSVDEAITPETDAGEASVEAETEENLSENEPAEPVDDEPVEAEPKSLVCFGLFSIDPTNALFPDENGALTQIEGIERWAGTGICFDNETGALFAPFWSKSKNDNALVVFNAKDAINEEKLLSGKSQSAVLFPTKRAVRISDSSDAFEFEACDLRDVPSSGGGRTFFFNNNSTAEKEGLYSTGLTVSDFETEPLVSDKTAVYTVSYAADGGNGTMANTKHIGGVSRRLRGNAFSDENGLPFLGWALERRSDGKWLFHLPDGSFDWFDFGSTPAGGRLALIGDNEPVVDLSPVSGDVITAHAQWFDPEKPLSSELSDEIENESEENPTFYEIVVRWVKTIVERIRSILSFGIL